MVVQGELPQENNRRGGPGWWMDLDGQWRSPEDWPEDYPPIDGWERGADGRWRAPLVPEEPVVAGPIVTMAKPEVTTRAVQTESRQARADRRAMYTVAGVIGGAMLLLAGALIVITQAGANDVDQPPAQTREVIYAAETDADRSQRQREMAELAPAQARTDLEALAVRDQVWEPQEPAIEPFDPLLWTADDEGCLDLAERVLVERSAVPITWADQLECVPDTGRWTDRNLGTVLDRTIDADVVSLVPSQIAYTSGGHRWTSATRQAFLTDRRHPATLQVVASGAGFNPRGSDPSAWRPSSEEAWCAYAVDWIAVKTRWGLDVHAAEITALEEMLDTCDTETSVGADPATVVLDPLAPAAIEFDVEG